MRKILLTLLVTFFTLFANAVEVRWYNTTSDKPYYQTITYSEVGTDSATAAYIIKTNATASNTMVKTTANGSGKSGYWSAKTTVSGSDFCDSIYVTFQVKSGYTFTFTHLSNFVAKVAGTATFKGFIKDNNGHELTSSQSSSTDDVNISFTSMSGTSFSGIVKVGLAFYSTESKYKSVYLADNLQFTGSISSSGGGCTATANAGADKNTTVNTGVALAATAAGDGKTGTWTVQSAPDGATGDYAPTFSSTSSATATFTPKVKGSYTLRWTVTCTEGESSANDDMEVSVCAPITPTFSTDYTSTTLTVGGDNSSTPVVDKDESSGAITWESSDKDVATVNSSGVVTPVASGSATITATVAANGDYCEGSVSKDFTINAAACSPSISASPSSANYCKDDVATALTFTGSGHNAQKWQYYDGDSWEDIDGATSATYTPSTSATVSTQYRVVTTCDSYTTTATSSAATITVKTSPNLTITLN